MSKEIVLSSKIMDSTQSTAIMLSLTNTLEQEKELKVVAESLGYRVAVTEFGGDDVEYGHKIVKAVVGAALNCNVIKKDVASIHAIIHAVGEAMKGFLANLGMRVNVALKIAIVRKDGWLSVAMYGDSALHYLTNHKRVGVGTMHVYDDK